MAKEIELIEEEPPLLTDRTTSETDWKCGMKVWWYKHEAGKGIVPKVEADYFLDGRDIHADTAELCEGLSVEEFFEKNPIPSTSDQLILERYTRRMGWAAGFGLYVLPRILEREEVVAVEREMVLQRDPLWLNLIPDLVTRVKQTGKGKYYEWKTCRYANRNWMEYWPYAVQLHAGIQAAEEDLGLPMQGGQVVGFLKGYEGYGRLNHPYVWAYASNDKWDTERRSGLTNAPVWEYPGGILAWVKQLGEEVALGKIFPHSEPIFVNPRLLDSFVQSRILREQEKRRVVAACQDDHDLRSLFFEQRFSECKPQVGSPCPYLAACWNATVNEDPLASGLYVPRTPHHELEIISQED